MSPQRRMTRRSHPGMQTDICSAFLAGVMDKRLPMTISCMMLSVKQGDGFAIGPRFCLTDRGAYTQFLS